MNVLLKALLTRLDNDAELTRSLNASITLDRQPVHPATLLGPAVVVGVLRDRDREDFHGAAVDAQVEVKVWGYAQKGPSDLPICLEAAERITELLLRRFDLGADGQTARVASDGWQRVDDTDPLTVHLTATFTAVYWSGARVAALTS